MNIINIAITIIFLVAFTVIGLHFAIYPQKNVDRKIAARIKTEKPPLTPKEMQRSLKSARLAGITLLVMVGLLLVSYLFL